MKKNDRVVSTRTNRPGLVEATYIPGLTRPGEIMVRFDGSADAVVVRAADLALETLADDFARQPVAKEIAKIADPKIAAALGDFVAALSKIPAVRR